MSSSLRLVAGTRAALLAVLALASCASVDEARMAEIELAWAGEASPDVHGNSVHGGGEPKPWKVGQWVRMRIDDGGTHGVRTVSVRQQDGSAWLLEVHEVRPEAETRAVVLVDGYVPGDAAALKVRKIEVRRPEGDLVDLADEAAGVPDAGAIRGRIEETLDAVRHRRATGNTQDVTVPAGEFRDVWTRAIFSRRAGDFYGGYVWYTSAVPVVGFAKVEVQRPWLEFLRRTSTTEVVAFGEQPEDPAPPSAVGSPPADAEVAAERKFDGR